MMYGLVRFMGWITVTCFGITLLRHVLRLKPFIGNKALKPLLTLLVRFHRPLGILTLAVGVAHGVLAVVNVSPSITGSLALLFLIDLALVGILMHFKRISAKRVRLHRWFAWILPGLIVLHVILPYVLLNG